MPRKKKRPQDADGSGKPAATKVEERPNALYLGVFAVLVVAILVGSILVRNPHIGQPMGDHHEFITAMGLRHMDIWYEVGAWESRWLPVVTYGLPADQNINKHSTVRDKDGKGYYASLPALGYVVPYVTLRALGIRPDVAPIQYFNIGVQFITALLLAGALWLLRPSSRWTSLAGPFAAFALYMLSPMTLWFHSNTYLSEMLAQMFFAATLLAFILYVQKPTSNLRLVSVGVIILLAVGTDWLGVFVGAGLALFGLRHYKKKSGKKLMFVSAGAVLAGIVGYFAHYSLMDGLKTIVDAFLFKYQNRSGLFGQSTYSPGDAAAWERIKTFIWEIGYGPWIVFAIVALLVVVALLATEKTKKKTTTREKAMRLADGPTRTVLLVALLAALAHNMVFFDFSAIHSYAWLKDGVFLSLFFGVVIAALFEVVVARWDQGSALWLALAVVLAAVPVVSKSLDRYEESANLGATDAYLRVGEFIKENAADDEVVFYDMSEALSLEPQIVYYAGRSIATWTTTEAAVGLVELDGVRGGVVIRLTPEGMLEATHFEAD